MRQVISQLLCPFLGLLLPVLDVRDLGHQHVIGCFTPTRLSGHIRSLGTGRTPIPLTYCTGAALVWSWMIFHPPVVLRISRVK